MEYIVKIKNKEYKVYVDRNKNFVKLGGKTFKFNVSKIDGGDQYSIIVNNRSFDVATDKTEHILNLKVAGDMYDLMVQDEKEYRALKILEKEVGGAKKGEVIKSIMPGLITKILVKKGDTVIEGTRLCIMEAMKMENEIKAGKNGKVDEVHVEIGKTVNSGDKLFSII